MTDNGNSLFHPIQLTDRKWINDRLTESDNASCEYSFANNFMYKGIYDVQVGDIEGCGVIRYKEKGVNTAFGYSFPFGNGNKRKAIEILRKLCRNSGEELYFYPVLENDRKNLIEWYNGEFEIDADRADFDYIYTVEKLASLRGKKLHGKRNHIARFMDDGDWHYEPMSAENIGGCREMAREWADMRADKWNDSMENELRVLDEAFYHFEELELVGGVLYKAGKIVAFTIGERLNSDTIVVHFEKAYPDLQGAYPMINQQFILHEGEKFTYVNREEDTGDLGLRKAKLSYYPDIILKKYRAKESDIVFANETDFDAIAEIWNESFGDDREYIDMYLTNRFETENMLVIHADGRPVSMLSILPALITVNGEKLAVRYVYAVATLPDYRNRGYATRLIEYAFNKYQEPLILQPACDELKEYYKGIGFKEMFKQSPCWIYNLCTENIKHGLKNCLCDADNVIEPVQENSYKNKTAQLGERKVTTISAKKYKEIRDICFAGEGYVEWDETAIAYAIYENAFCGGDTLMLSDDTGQKNDVLMYRVHDVNEVRKLQIIETTLNEDELKKILPELMNLTCTMQAYQKNEGGMMLHTKETSEWDCSEAYLNLTLG